MRALEETLAGFDSEAANNIRIQANALQRLSEVSAELQNYRQVFGDLGRQPPDVARLVSQLRQKEAELKKLQLVARELEAVCDALCNASVKLTVFRTSPLYIQSWIS